MHNIGQGCVLCLDYGERYILTFPSGYGRSILTVPQVELGGEHDIDCFRMAVCKYLPLLTFLMEQEAQNYTRVFLQMIRNLFAHFQGNGMV